MKRIEQGHPAHFCGSNDCQFRRSTYISNGYIVSTVGELQWKSFKQLKEYKKNEFEILGGDGRIYETFVFKASDKPRDDCGCYVVSDYEQIDSESAFNAKEAQYNHENLVNKWMEK